jgi:hypothetical protein
VNKDWLADMTGDVDEAGWEYAFQFHGSIWHGEPFSDSTELTIDATASNKCSLFQETINTSDHLHEGENGFA